MRRTEAESAMGSFLRSSALLLTSSKLNVLLFLIPFCVIGWQSGWNDGVVLILGIASLVPLAERIGFVTESVSEFVGEFLGGLANATMGNLPELIVCFNALYRRELRLIQLSLVGSVFGNLLLVLGSALIAGGARHREQAVNLRAAEPQLALLVLGAMTVLMPAALKFSGEADASSELAYSRAVSLVLVAMYVALIFFQLRTHNYLFMEGDEEDGAGIKGKGPLQSRDEARGAAADAAPGDMALPPAAPSGAAGPREGDEQALSFSHGMIWLGILAAATSFVSDAVVDVLDAASRDLRVPGAFIATVILPIANNACEHACAIMFALRGQMDIALGATVGSAVQICLFVLPFTVILGWLSGIGLTLFFDGFETAALFSAVLIATVSIRSGKSTWLTGVLMIGAYAVIALGFLLASSISMDDTAA